MRKGIFRMAVFCLAALLLAGISTACSAGTPEETPPAGLTVTDQLGRTVTLDKVPERIVSMAPSNTEILFALGLGDKVVGDTTYCDYPPEARDKPKIGGFSTPNLEEIIALSPDLVVAAQRHEDEIIPQLEEKGLKVIALDPKDFDSIMGAITLVGKATGSGDKAAALVDSMETRIKAVTDKVSGLTDDEKPGVFYLTWADPLMTSGSGSLNDELIEKAGGRNIFADVSGVQDIDLETLVNRDPQVMIAGIGMGTGEDKPLVYLQEETRLQDTDAAKNGNIYGVDLDLSGRGGPRIVDGLEEFARCIHPELFGQP